jgi:hypothetical protein
LQDVILRPSCYACKAKEFRSHSDVTIADFWGIQNVCPEMDDDKGTGLVFVHTEKGKRYFLTEKVRYKEVSYEEGSRSNPAIYRSSKPWPRRNSFFSKIDSKDSVIELIRDTLKPTLRMRIRSIIIFIKQIPKRVGGGKFVQVNNIKNVPDKLDKNNTSNNNLMEVLQVRQYKIDSMIFRSKDNGWSAYQMRIQFKAED